MAVSLSPVIAMATAPLKSVSLSAVLVFATASLPAIRVSAALSFAAAPLKSVSLSAAMAMETLALTDGIDGRQIALRTISNDRVVLNALTAGEIAAGTITPTELDRAYQAALGTLSKGADLFRDITGVTATTDVEVNDEDAASFADAASSGVRVAFEIPTNYVVTGSVQVFLRISPSTSVAADFRIDVDHRRNGGALVGAVQTTVTPSATADTQTLVGPVLSLTTAGIAADDGLALRVKRLGADGADTHTGAMQLFSVVIRYAV